MYNVNCYLATFATYLNGIETSSNIPPGSNIHTNRKNNAMEMARYLSNLKSIEDMKIDYEHYQYPISSYWNILPQLFCVTYNVNVNIYRIISKKFVRNVFTPKETMKEWNIKESDIKKLKKANENKFQNDAINIFKFDNNYNNFVLLEQV